MLNTSFTILITLVSLKAEFSLNTPIIKYQRQNNTLEEEEALIDDKLTNLEDEVAYLKNKMENKITTIKTTTVHITSFNSLEQENNEVRSLNNDKPVVYQEFPHKTNDSAITMKEHTIKTIEKPIHKTRINTIKKAGEKGSSFSPIDYKPKFISIGGKQTDKVERKADQSKDIDKSKEGSLIGLTDNRFREINLNCKNKGISFERRKEKNKPSHNYVIKKKDLESTEESEEEIIDKSVKLKDIQRSKIHEYFPDKQLNQILIGKTVDCQGY